MNTETTLAELTEFDVLSICPQGTTQDAAICDLLGADYLAFAVKVAVDGYLVEGTIYTGADLAEVVLGGLGEALSGYSDQSTRFACARLLEAARTS